MLKDIVHLQTEHLSELHIHASTQQVRNLNLCIINGHHKKAKFELVNRIKASYNKAYDTIDLAWNMAFAQCMRSISRMEYQSEMATLAGFCEALEATVAGIIRPTRRVLDSTGQPTDNSHWEGFCFMVDYSVVAIALIHTILQLSVIKAS